MKKYLLLLSLLLLAEQAVAANFAKPEPPAPVAIAQPAPTCVDDPRLNSDLLDILAQDAPVVRPPLVITAETFIQLNDTVRKKLAGNAMICPGIPYQSDGTPGGRIEISFPVLWRELLKAAYVKDEGRIRTLMSTYHSKPMKPMEVVALCTKIPLNSETGPFLYKAAGLEPGNFPSVIDFFIATGGRSSEQIPAHIENVRDVRREIMERAAKGEQAVVTRDIFSDWGRRWSTEALEERLKSAGLLVQ